MDRVSRAMVVVLFMAFTGIARAQTPPPPEDQPKLVSAQPSSTGAQPSTAAQPTTITLPAGTKMLVVLKSPLHTTSGVSGSGIYSETASAVVQDNRVVIPLRTQVQGVVESEKRPGRVKGKASFLLHFNTLVLPNNYVVPIDGTLQSIPGSTQVRRKKHGKEVEPVDQIDKDAKRIFTPALAGAALGSLSSLGPGTFLGAGAGGLFGLGVTLFTRGDEIRLEQGSTLEVVLQQPVTLDVGRIP
jgi:hypothetical protein